eukprot:scaffold37110_cov80-Skeletonema_marinoi.AAC.1
MERGTRKSLSSTQLERTHNQSRSSRLRTHKPARSTQSHTSSKIHAPSRISPYYQQSRSNNT